MDYIKETGPNLNWTQRKDRNAKKNFYGAHYSSATKERSNFTWYIYYFINYWKFY